MSKWRSAPQRMNRKRSDFTSLFLFSVPEKITQDKLHDSLFLKALEGFIVIISAEGDLVYLSENVNEYLGITQV